MDNLPQDSKNVDTPPRSKLAAKPFQRKPRKFELNDPAIGCRIASVAAQKARHCVTVE